jgi:hypothetical protein
MPSRRTLCFVISLLSQYHRSPQVPGYHSIPVVPCQKGCLGSGYSQEVFAMGQESPTGAGVRAKVKQPKALECTIPGIRSPPV